MPGKPYTPAERAAMRRKKATSGTGIGRLTRVLSSKSAQGKKDAATGAKNARGVQTPTEAEKKRVRHRLELKYPKTYPGGGRS